jgi:hypothetical protein
MLVQNDGALSVERIRGVHESVTSRLFNPGLAARLMARLRSRALDGSLIEGADPATTPQLAARAALLTSRSTRKRIAAALERLAWTESDRARRMRVQPFKRAVHENAPELYALAALLRGPDPVYAQGVAMLRQLVIDGAGPAYTDRNGGALAGHLRSARSSLRLG